MKAQAHRPACFTSLTATARGPATGTYNPVENLEAEVNIGVITLTWDAPEDATNFIISRNGVELAQTAEASYADTVSDESVYTYCVVAEYEDGMSNPECVIAKAELGVDDMDAQFTVYPNPASSTLTVECGNDEFNYAMFNGLGQQVANGIAQGSRQINVGGLEKGVYYLRLTNGTQTLVEKVVVE